MTVVVNLFPFSLLSCVFFYPAYPDDEHPS